MNYIQSIINSLKHSPLKSFLTLFTVGLGVGILIFTLSISAIFSEKIARELESEGIILTVANAEYTSSNGLQIAKSGTHFDETVFDIIKTDVPGVVTVSPIDRPGFNEFMVNNKTYRIRSIITSDENYDDVTGMKMILGSYFTKEDLEKSVKTAVISESLAVTLFGSMDNALGQVLEFPSQNQNARRSVPPLTVSGIYEDYSELKRKAYGLGDVVIPYTSLLQGKFFYVWRLVVRLEGTDAKQAEAQIRDVLTRAYGYDLTLHIWEGTPAGGTSLLDETRSSINTFTMVINLLGFLLLVTGSIGILSIMLVEVLGRSRDIALERALGASKVMIITEYFIRAIGMTAISVVLGIIMSLFFSGPLKDIIMPIFNTISTIETNGIISPFAIAVSSGAALLIGGIFGIMPVFSTFKTVIADGIRES